jgi:hypothetical protein
VRPTSSSSQPRSYLLTYLGAAAVAGGILFYAYRQFFTGAAQDALEATSSAIKDGFQTKRLQREAAARLNDFSSQLQNDVNVDLSAKNLGDEGTAYVVEALAFNSSCRAVNLSNNGIKTVGTAQLCEVLPTCAVQTLLLASNSLGDEGADLLAKKLSGNGTLQHVDLSSNGIGDVGAAALAEALKVNTTLTRLDLQ